MHLFNIKIRARPVPWITSSKKELINTRDKLKRKAITTNLKNDWLNYTRTRNRVNIELRNAKKDYYSMKIADDKSNPKQAWKTINSLLGSEAKTRRKQLNKP